MGLGLLGRGLGDTIFLAKQGARVTVTDLKTKAQLKDSIKKLKGLKVKMVLGRHRIEDFEKADMILKAAGVPLDSPYIKTARKNGIPIEMDESLFAKYCPCPIIGITGTRGKTTTTYLIYEIAKLTGKKVWLGGNIKGVATLPLINKVKMNDLVVMELSSWQLQGWHEAKISPHIAVFTNIYPDHLNYYKNSLRDYIYDKKAIYKYQNKNDFLIINKENKYTKQIGKEAKSKVIWFSEKDCNRSWKIKLLGRHNLENVSAAIKVGQILGVSMNKIKKAVENFKGVEGRLELIREINGIKIYNDTTSTTPVALSKALNSFNKKVVLITGGTDKNLDLKDVINDIKNKAKKVILLPGNGTDRLIKELKKQKHGEYFLCDSLKKVVDLAFSFAGKGDIILFSPGFTSFGMFKNEFDRGEKFVKIVQSF